MEHTEALEQIIDKQGLANTLADLAQICYLKEEHVQTNWQDKSLASDWHRAGNSLTTAELKVKELGL